MRSYGQNPSSADVGTGSWFRRDGDRSVTGFPIRHRGQIVWHAKSDVDPLAFMQAFTSAASSALAGERATKIWVEGTRVSFIKKKRAGLIRRSNKIGMIDRGQIDIARHGTEFLVTYDLSFLRIFVTMFLLMMASFGILFIVVAPEVPLVVKVAFGPCLFLLAFTLNYVVQVVRFKPFVRTMLQHAASLQHEP